MYNANNVVITHLVYGVNSFYSGRVGNVEVVACWQIEKQKYFVKSCRVLYKMGLRKVIPTLHL